MLNLNTSKITYLAISSIILVLAYLHESEIIGTGYWKANPQTEYFVQLFCTLSTLGLSWFSLRLFSIKKIRKIIDYCPESLRRWNLIRIAMISIPMLFNFEIYYAIIDNQSILYCFLITLIAFIFCWPQKWKPIKD